MNIKNMPLMIKIVCFLLFSIIALSTVTVISIKDVKAVFNTMETKIKGQNYESISSVLNADRDMYQAYSGIVALMNPNLKAEEKEKQIDFYKANIAEATDRLAKARGKFSSDDEFWKDYKGKDGKVILDYFNDFDSSFKEFTANADDMLKGNIKDDLWNKKFDEARTSLNSIGELIDSGTEVVIDKSRTDKDSMVRTIFIFDLSFVFLMLGLTYLLYLLVIKPMKNLADIAKVVSKGDVDVKIDIDSKDDIGKLADAFRDVVAYFKSQSEAVEMVANGKMDFKVTERSEKDVLSKSIVKMTSTLENVLKQVGKLTEAGTLGKLTIRGNQDEFVGDYKEIIVGINNTLDAFVKPIQESSIVLDRIAENDYTIEMKGNYNGDFAELSNKINIVRSRLVSVQDISVMVSKGDFSLYNEFSKVGKRSENDQLIPALTNMMFNIMELNSEIARIAKAAKVGDLNYRGDTSKFPGMYGDVIKGLNEALDAISFPINKVSEILSQMSKGHIDVTMEGDFKGDYAVMKDSINNTINSLNSLIGDITEAAEQVAISSKQISEGSVQLSQGATEQASSIEELSSSMVEISAQTKQNATYASQASELALNAKVSAAQGNEQMGEMLKAMDEINDTSSNISKIIKVIDEIAFQTNILALNAAVEAARAGQHGKGFAVVAEEVRNLAARSADAAKETTEFIEGSIKKVECGTKIANETAESLGKIVSNSSKVAQLVGDIASASNEQASGIAQINLGIEQVSKVIQINSATSQESASSSEELLYQAEALKENIKQFTLKNSFESQKSFSRSGETKRFGAKPNVNNYRNMARQQDDDSKSNDNKYGKF